MIFPSKYQPLLFTKDGYTNCNECGTGCDSIAGNWVQKMFANDDVTFQFQVTPCPDATNLAQNPNFSSNGDGWDSSGIVSYTSQGAIIGSAGQVSLSVFDPYKWYLIKLSTDAIAHPLLRVHNGNGLGYEYYPVTETREFYIQTGADGKIIFERVSGDFNTAADFLNINYVVISPIELPDVYVQDLEGNTLEVIAPISFEIPYFNVQYSPNTAAVDAGTFVFRVGQSCSNEEPPEYWYSEPIQVIPSDDCFIQIAGCSNNNLFGDSFFPFMRIEAKLIADRAPIYDRYMSRKTSGRWRLNYGRAAKAFTFTTGYIPEHVRDFIYLLPMFDMIAIKRGTSLQEVYYCDESPDAPDFLPSSDSLAKIIVPLVYKEELIESIFKQECNVILPPKVLGWREEDLIIKAGEDTAINAG